MTWTFKLKDAEEGGPQSWRNASGLSASQANPEIEVDSEEEKQYLERFDFFEAVESDSEGDSSETETEPETETEIDPSEYTVEELEDELEQIDTAEELEAIGDAEEAGKNRDTALDAIDSRLSEVHAASEEE